MITYEEALKELQTIVQALQEGNIGIDDLSEKVSRASELIQYCREKLRKTEVDLAGLLMGNE